MNTTRIVHINIINLCISNRNSRVNILAIKNNLNYRMSTLS